MILLYGCSNSPKVITRTETVPVYVAQYREYDFSQIQCQQTEVQQGQTWLELVINLKEMVALCVAEIKTIRKTINTNSP